MVRLEGVEPPRLTALDPKSSVSTSSTTGASEVMLIVSCLGYCLFSKEWKIQT